MLKKSVVFVGPDRCWKSTLCRMVAREFNVEPYAGRQGTEAITGTKLFHEAPTVYDRGIICARAYDVLFSRPARSEKDYIYCETMMCRSGALYVFMDRDDFSSVHDEKDKLVAEDLTKLSEIYKRLMPTSCVPCMRFAVEDDTGTDLVKLNTLFRDILSFIEANDGIADAEE